MRRFSFTVLLVVICLLPVGIGSGTSAHSQISAEASTLRRKSRDGSERWS